MSDATAEKMPDAQWRPLDFASAEKAEKSLAIARHIMPTTGLGARAYNVEFELGAERDWGAVRAYVLGGGTTASTSTRGVYRFGPEVAYLELEFTGNTGQSVTVEAIGTTYAY